MNYDDNTLFYVLYPKMSVHGGYFGYEVKGIDSLKNILESDPWKYDKEFSIMYSTALISPTPSEDNYIGYWNDESHRWVLLSKEKIKYRQQKISKRNLIVKRKQTFQLLHSRDITKYRTLLEGLVEDFDYIYWHSILSWCRIIDKPIVPNKELDERFWKLWLICRGNVEHWNTVELDKSIFGMCGLYSINQDIENTEELWLAWFGILKQHRNQGLGTEVLKELEKLARGFGAKVLRSYVDREGKPLNFYKKNGFKIIGTVKKFLKKHTEMTMEDFQNDDDFIIEKML
jgi:GNAT superfamily N-acetyltransferase